MVSYILSASFVTNIILKSLGKARLPNFGVEISKLESWKYEKKSTRIQIFD